jgi:peptidylprolyl isomerase
VPRRLALLLLPVLVLAACGGDDDDDAGAAATTATTAAATATTAPVPLVAAADDPLLDAVKVDGAFGTPPTITVPSAFATTQTVRRVLQPGTGAAFEDGAHFVFDSVAVDGNNGKVLAGSFGETPASAELSASSILPGFVKGLLGVNVGSRVLIAMAPDDAFGPTGGIEDQGVAATDTMVFVVDVRDVRTPLARAEGAPVPPVAGQPTVALDANGAPTITMPGGNPPTALVAQPTWAPSGVPAPSSTRPGSATSRRASPSATAASSPGGTRASSARRSARRCSS